MRFPDTPGGGGRIVLGGGVFRAGPWSGPPPAGGWAEALEIFASEAADAPAMLGSYGREAGLITFTPRFVPAPAVRLRAVFRPRDGEPVTAWFGGVAAPPRAPTTRIVSVTPSADAWPENILRFYVTFSAPMRIGVAWEHIRMLDANGLPMGGMFVEIDQELWDPEGRRFTVLFDPGRIKRGLVDNINEGPPLTVGEAVTLEIEHYWRDAAGGLLTGPYAKTVTVAPPIRAPLDPAAWRLTPPSAPAAPLILDTPVPIDAALAVRAFTVTHASTPVHMTATLDNAETRILLTPDAPWRPGPHSLHISNILEDIAGNRIGRPFDIDRQDPAQAEAAARDAELTFEV